MAEVTGEIAAGLECWRQNFPHVCSRSAAEPIFILSAGWRSGSTLVQRALMSQALIWGEPYGHAGLIDHLAAPLRAFGDHWPASWMFYRGQPRSELATQFTANLFPEPREFLEANLSYFRRLFVQPAEARGHERWGIKSVRLSADHACYLRWLFPRCKLIFLHRNPWDAYRSYAGRAYHGLGWPAQHGEGAMTAGRFARHWRDLVESWREFPGDYCRLSYESLADDGWRRLAEYLGCEPDRRAIDCRPADGGPPPLEQLSESDLALVTSTLQSTAAKLGYQPPVAAR